MHQTTNDVVFVVHFNLTYYCFKLTQLSVVAQNAKFLSLKHAFFELKILLNHNNTSMLQEMFCNDPFGWKPRVSHKRLRLLAVLIACP
jgi:hypothetical protein